MTSVVFSLEVLPRAGGSCRWFDPLRALVTRSCSDPVLVRARLAKGGSWSYNGPRAPAPAGGPLPRDRVGDRPLRRVRQHGAHGAAQRHVPGSSPSSSAIMSDERSEPSRRR